MQDDQMTPRATDEDETLHVTPQAVPVPTVEAAPGAVTEPVRAGRSLVPFGLAAVVAGLGVAAIAVASAAGGSATSGAASIPQGVALVSNASPTPAGNGQAPQGGPGGWIGPAGGRGMMGGMMGGRLGGPRGAITVTSITGSQLTLKTDDGWTRTIDASGATVTKGGAAATLADITVGTPIEFAQQRNADGTFTVTKIDIEMPRVAGTATAIGGSTITLKAMDGSTVTITVTSSTTYRVAGAQSATLADVKVGDIVMATGAKAADGSLTATVVAAFTPGATGPGMGGGRGWDGDGRHDWPGQGAPNASPSAVPGA